VRDAIPVAVAVCSPAVSHEELRALLPAYAAGELDTALAEMVRAHLAEGCTACLHEMFALPIGVQRGAPVVAALTEPPPVEQPAEEPAPVARRSSLRPLVGATVLLAVACAALAAWSIVELRAREAAARAEGVRLAGRVTELEALRAALTERAAAAERARSEAEAEASRQADAVRTTAEASAELRHELEAAETRIETLTRGLQRRDREVDRLLGGIDGQRGLQDLVATPGMEIVRLGPVGAVRRGRGHALWHPAREIVIVYAFDLPELGGGGRYRVRVRLENGLVVTGPPLDRGARGDIVESVRVGAGSGRVREVEVVSEVSGTPVLAGRTAPPSG
jgi:hypothetical protein